MSAKTAESLETPQEDIWLPQWREGIFSIFKRSIAVKSEGLPPAVLCLADTPNLSNSAFPNSGAAGLFLRLRWHCLERPPAEESNCYQQGCLFLCFLLSEATSWYHTTEPLSKRLSDCSSIIFCSGPWSQHHPSLLLTTPSLTIQLQSISLSSLPHFLSPKNLQGSINTKMPIYWFIR